MFFRPFDEEVMKSNYDQWLNDRLAEIGSGNNPDLGIFPGPFFSYDNNDIPRNTIGLELFYDHGLKRNEHSFRPWANLSFLYSRLAEDMIYQSNGFDTEAPPVLGGNERWFEFERNLGDDVNSPPMWKINLGLEWKHHDSGIFIHPAMRFVDSQKLLSFAYSDLRAEPTNVLVQEIPAYVAVDLALGWEFGEPSGTNGSFTLGVMNIFDDRHHESLEASLESLDSEYDPTYTSRIGRAWSLRGQVSF